MKIMANLDFSLNIFTIVGIYSLYLSLFKSTCFWTLILLTSFPTGPCPSNLTPASLNNFFAVIGLLTSIASEIISSMDVTPLFGDVNDRVARLSSYICLAISPFKLLSKLLGSSSYNSNSFSLPISLYLSLSFLYFCQLMHLCPVELTF